MTTSKPATPRTDAILAEDSWLPLADLCRQLETELSSARLVALEEAAALCDKLYHATEITCAWDEGEATGYDEAAKAIRLLSKEVK